VRAQVRFLCQSRRLGGQPATSGLAPQTDMVTATSGLPKQRTSLDRPGMSQRCQKRKHWIGQLYFRLASWAVFTVRNGLDHPI
jgi:hypothetical protein